MHNNIEKAVDVLGNAIDDLIEERDELCDMMDKLRTERDRLRREMGLTAAQRTSYEVIEEEGSDEHADYRGAYDLIIEQTRAALHSTQQEEES